MALMSEIDFKEEADYNRQEGSLKEIVLRHIRKISDICCKEFTPGYWQERPMKVQGGVIFTKEYHEDTRAEYCNAVDFLVDVVYPLGDSKFKDYVDGLDKNEDDKDLDKRQKEKRKVFKEINRMFERTNFFTKSDSVSE